MSAAEKRVMRYAEYLAAEGQSPVRMEFVDGVAYAMAGGSPRHGELAAEMIFALQTLLRQGHGRCKVFTADVKVHVTASGNSYYPDVSVACGPSEVAVVDDQAITNPVLLVEVLSERTESYDRGRKFRDYQRIPSLRHYLLVSQDEARIEHFQRNDDDTWTLRIAEAGALVHLPELGGALSVDAVFERVLDSA